ncbi:uncharacterized protein si:dkeyp-80c12.8 isoform X2 [Siniperca chuatsi]|uniref:uncharacterized protein si:dkeyp-80c12.8 isoform X2 n=1 Tax=Siniperca chuatsi TaxID=119488 RepID=UPI001CE0755D|nr:uncharacterized protein si:dkeyp-80c12.8 isoform X2 [Siniperca chuatsi]
MKTVIVALLVLLVVSQGEALKCYCGGLKHCLNPAETCHGLNDVCAKVTFSAGFTGSYFQGCVKAIECMIENRRGVSATCCSRNLCNG